jgi:hypothetical protein
LQARLLAFQAGGLGAVALDMPPAACIARLFQWDSAHFIVKEALLMEQSSLSGDSINNAVGSRFILAHLSAALAVYGSPPEAATDVFLGLYFNLTLIHYGCAVVTTWFLFAKNGCVGGDCFVGILVFTVHSTGIYFCLWQSRCSLLHVQRLLFAGDLY